MMWAFNLLLRCYPRDHRHLFGDEMRSVFCQAADDYRGSARISYARFLATELAGLAWGAGIRWSIILKRADHGFLRTAASVSGGVFVAALGQLILYKTLLRFWR